MHRLFNLKPFEYINHAEKCGLFRFRHLDSAADFEKASLHAVSTCQKLLDQISASDALAINRLDRLSNILCAVVDTAEVIRNVHPDKAYVLSANNVHSTLSNFMNNLNVNVDLYNVPLFIIN
jgi:intermediate peptidase